MRCHAAMEHAAVPVGPLHHGSNAKSVISFGHSTAMPKQDARSHIRAGPADLGSIDKIAQAAPEKPEQPVQDRGQLLKANHRQPQQLWCHHS